MTSSLAGKRVVITRAKAQSTSLFDQLVSRGAITKVLPLIQIAPLEDFAPLDSALEKLHQFDWLIFTSENAVQAIASRMDEKKLLSSLSNVKAKIAAVGPNTALAAEKAGFRIQYIAHTRSGIHLAQELQQEWPNRCIFLPRSNRARHDLPDALRKFGAIVTEVVTYRTLFPLETSEAEVRALNGSNTDAILFFSPSAVGQYIELIGDEVFRALDHQLLLAAVGPITAKALREFGASRILVAQDATSASVIEALEKYFAGRQKSSGAGAHQE